jgi:hypothetical protein
MSIGALLQVSSYNVAQIMTGRIIARIGNGTFKKKSFSIRTVIDF